MAVVVTDFAGMSGNVPASTLDEAFAEALAAESPANTLMGNNTGGSANAQPLSGSQALEVIVPYILVEIAGFMGGVQGGASWQILRYQSVDDFNIDQVDCIASAGIAATGSTTFTIADNGGSIGTVVFGASSAVGTVTISGGTYNLIGGHVLTVTGPSSADATLANVNVTLGGSRI